MVFYVDRFSLLQAYVDLAFYFDTPTMHKLVKVRACLQCDLAVLATKTLESHSLVIVSIMGYAMGTYNIST